MEIPEGDYLSFLRPSEEVLVLYQKDRDLDRILFEHMNSGLRKGDSIIYLAGTRTADEAKKALFSYGIDVDSHNDYNKKGNLAFLTYDDLFLTRGVLDIEKLHSRLSSVMRKITWQNHNSNVRLVAESNWWIWADVFEEGLKAEETHPAFPSSLSTVCSYRISDLLDYVRVYHIAKLVDLHKHALWTGNLEEGPLMHSNELVSHIKAMILSTINELGLRVSHTQTNRSVNYLSLTELIQSVEDQGEIAELESVIESRLRRTLAD